MVSFAEDHCKSDTWSSHHTLLGLIPASAVWLSKCFYWQNESKSAFYKRRKPDAVNSLFNLSNKRRCYGGDLRQIPTRSKEGWDGGEYSSTNRIAIIIDQDDIVRVELRDIGLADGLFTTDDDRFLHLPFDRQKNFITQTSSQPCARQIVVPFVTMDNSWQTLVHIAVQG